MLPAVPQRPRHRGLDDRGRLLPTTEGTNWQYATTQADENGKSSPGSYEVVAWGNVPLKDSAGCSQLIACRSGYANTEYVLVDADGIHQLSRRGMGQVRGASRRNVQLLLKAPVGAHTEWRWTNRMTYQTSVAGSGDNLRVRRRADPNEDNIERHAELVSFDESVTVPAGTFRCAHVRITSKCKKWNIDETRDLWFGRGTGIVRERWLRANGAYARELTAFTPGPRAEPRDYEATLAGYLGAEHGLGEPKVIWVEPRHAHLNHYLHGRFAVVDQPGRPRTSYYVDRNVTEFRDGDTAFWLARLHEAHGLWSARTDTAPPLTKVARRLQLNELADMMARSHATRAGLTDLESKGRTNRSERGEHPHYESEVNIRGQAADGAWHDLTATLRVDTETVRRAEVSVQPPLGR